MGLGRLSPVFFDKSLKIGGLPSWVKNIIISNEVLILRLSSKSGKTFVKNFKNWIVRNPNGLAIIDNCGECLEPTNPTFNQTCEDGK